MSNETKKQHVFFIKVGAVVKYSWRHFPVVFVEGIKLFYAQISYCEQ